MTMEELAQKAWDTLRGDGDPKDISEHGDRPGLLFVAGEVLAGRPDATPFALACVQVLSAPVVEPVKFIMAKKGK